MKVKDLIADLSILDPDKEVILCIDSGVTILYSPCMDISEGKYIPNHNFDDLQFTSDIEEDMRDGYVTKADRDTAYDTVCIWAITSGL